MPQAAHAKYCQALTRRNSRLCERPIHRDACTEKRCSLNEGETVRNFRRMACWRFNKFCVAPIHGDARDLLFHAEVLIPFPAEFTLAARPVNPRDSNPISDS